MKTTSWKEWRQIADKNGINRKTFAARVRKGMNLEIAANKPLFKPRDLTGRTFGRLVVLGHGGYNKKHQDKWLCKCSCGNQKIIYANSLINSKHRTLSCGCLSLEKSTTHGASYDSTYLIWQGIKQRCSDKNCKTYPRYGGRGIAMCDRWKSDYLNFLSDMGKKPKGKSIERIDNNGNYEPSNCRWATAKEQSRNRRSNIKIFYKNELRILIDWCEYLGLSYKTVGGRLRDGWTIERAFETPIRKRPHKVRRLQ